MLYYRVADTSNRWLPSSTRASSRSLLLLCLHLAFAAACVVLRGLMMGTVTACPAADSTSMGVLLLAPALMPLPLHKFCLSDPCCSLRDSSRRRMRAWGDACATWAAAATARGSCTCCSDIGKCCMNMRRSAVKSRPISKSNVNGCMHSYEYLPRIPLAFAAVCCSHCFSPVLSFSSSTIAVRVSAGHEYLATNKTHTANTQMVLVQG